MTDEYPVHDWKPIQQRLRDLVFYAGRIDGERGPLTDQAIVAFKRAVGFVARSFYGPQTHHALISAPVAAEESPDPGTARRNCYWVCRADPHELSAGMVRSVGPTDRSPRNRLVRRLPGDLPAQIAARDRAAPQPVRRAPVGSLRRGLHAPAGRSADLLARRELGLAGPRRLLRR